MLIAPDTVAGPGGAAMVLSVDVEELVIAAGRVVAPIHSLKMNLPSLRFGVMAGSANLRWRGQQQQ
jgi:hypothetical protein